jgi:transcriptional antiterminator
VSQLLENSGVWYQERFDLLLESGQADQASVAAAKLALGMVEEAYGVQLSEELGASLATHLAITLKKLVQGQPLTPAPEQVWQELKEYPAEVALAGRIVMRLEEKLNITLARDELGFIAIHLCKIRIELSQGGGS